MTRSLLRLLTFTVLLFTSYAVTADDTAITPETHDYDKVNGDEINQVCAGCHGEFGMGGKEGKYPRLAGMPVEYLFKEMKRFQDRERPNMPMVEHVEKRQMPITDVIDVSIFLSKIKLATRLSKIDENAPDFDAYARLQEAKRTIQIGRSDGDVKVGKRLYNKECKSCHGKLGEGDYEDATPQLAGQYIQYLQRQIKLYIRSDRTHDVDDPEEEFFKSFSSKEMQDIFAYVSILDD